MRGAAVFALLALAGCGGSPPASPTGDVTTGGECPARGPLAEAEAALSACRASHADDPDWPGRDAYEALMPHLSAHLASLDPPHEVPTDVAQALAEEIWALLDRVVLPAGDDAVRARAENAAERLLRDRDVRAAPGAAIEALDVLSELGHAADPTAGADPCASESARVSEARPAEMDCERGGA